MVDFNNPVEVGILFMGIGVVLFLIEATMPGFFIGVVATILLILGVVAYNTPAESFATFWKFAPLIVVVAGSVATAVTFWVYRRMAPPNEPPTTKSADSLLTEVATVTRVVEPGNGRGKVKIGRETWSATTDGPAIPEGRKVRVTKVEGVILNVIESEESR